MSVVNATEPSTIDRILEFPWHMHGILIVFVITFVTGITKGSAIVGWFGAIGAIVMIVRMFIIINDEKYLEE